MNKLLWQPLEETKQDANMTRFIRFVNDRHGLALADYDALANPQSLDHYEKLVPELQRE